MFDITIFFNCLFLTDGLLGDRRMVRSNTNSGPSTKFTGDVVEINDDDFVAEPIKKGTLFRR